MLDKFKNMQMTQVIICEKWILITFVFKFSGHAGGLMVTVKVTFTERLQVGFPRLPYVFVCEYLSKKRRKEIKKRPSISLNKESIVVENENSVKIAQRLLRRNLVFLKCLSKDFGMPKQIKSKKIK